MSCVLVKVSVIEKGLYIHSFIYYPNNSYGDILLTKFEVYNDGEYWCARGIGEDIFTQGKTLDELMNNLKEAIELNCTDI